VDGGFFSTEELLIVSNLLNAVTHDVTTITLSDHVYSALTFLQLRNLMDASDASCVKHIEDSGMYPRISRPTIRNFVVTSNAFKTHSNAAFVF